MASATSSRVARGRLSDMLVSRVNAEPASWPVAGSETEVHARHAPGQLYRVRLLLAPERGHWGGQEKDVAAGHNGGVDLAGRAPAVSRVPARIRGEHERGGRRRPGGGTGAAEGRGSVGGVELWAGAGAGGGRLPY